MYKVKTDSTGKIARYKARVVAQGFSQKKDIDYSESYAPVANISLIRLLIAMSMSHDWKIHHLDVKCAYLYGNLKEEIYMRLPPGHKDYNIKVAKLLRPIYGLKQLGRNWNKTIDKYLIKHGFRRLQPRQHINPKDDEKMSFLSHLFGKTKRRIKDVFLITQKSRLLKDI